VKLNNRERELILNHSFADAESTARLRIVPERGEEPAYRFILDELDDLAGHVAAVANHAKSNKLQKEWDQLYDRLQGVLDSCTDEHD
jgi:hypothetical protein